MLEPSFLLQVVSGELQDPGEVESVEKDQGAGGPDVVGILGWCRHPDNRSQRSPSVMSTVRPREGVLDLQRWNEVPPPGPTQEVGDSAAVVPSVEPAVEAGWLIVASSRPRESIQVSSCTQASMRRCAQRRELSVKRPVRSTCR